MSNYTDIAVKEVNVSGFNIYILQDDTQEEPFDGYMPDTWGIDLSNHRDYPSPTYGDEMPASMGTVVAAQSVGELDKVLDGYHYLPVYMYDHGGRTVNVVPYSCPWDSGCAGVVYVSKEAAKREGIVDALRFLKSTVEELDAHMRGEVYGYIITDPDGEEVDSCWGFVGDIEYCEEEARGAAEYFIRDAARQLQLDP